MCARESIAIACEFAHVCVRMTGECVKCRCRTSRLGKIYWADPLLAKEGAALQRAGEECCEIHQSHPSQQHPAREPVGWRDLASAQSTAPVDGVDEDKGCCIQHFDYGC